MGVVFTVACATITIAGAMCVAHFFVMVSRRPTWILLSAPHTYWTIRQRLYVGLVGIGLLIFGYGGSKNLLWFIPSSTGHTEDGDWMPFTTSVALITCLIGVWIGQKLYEFAEAKVRLTIASTKADQLERMLTYSLPNFRFAQDELGRKIADPNTAQELKEAYHDLLFIANKRIEVLEKLELGAKA